MFKNFKESFNLTNKYIILATPLILFSLLSSLYLLFSMQGLVASTTMFFAKSGSYFGVIFAIIPFFLMLGAFLAGWFYMLKTCVTLPEDNENGNVILKEFLSGVGEYFLPALGLIFVIFIIMFAIMAGGYFAGMKFIGDIGISPEALSKSLESAAALKAFLTSLTQEQMIRLNAWNLLIFTTIAFSYFLIMFYPTALMFKTKNPFKAFFIGVKDLFSRKFFKNLGIFITLVVIYFVLSMLAAIFSNNIVLHFVFTILDFYCKVFVAVLIFDYYYSNYIKVGGNLDERV